MPDFISKILTPTGRAIFGFVQLVLYIGMGFAVLYQFTLGHKDASAATTNPAMSLTSQVKKVEKKVDVALDAINDLRIDMSAVMDKMQVPESKRASSRHAIPANFNEAGQEEP